MNTHIILPDTLQKRKGFLSIKIIFLGILAMFEAFISHAVTVIWIKFYNTETLDFA